MWTFRLLPIALNANPKEEVVLPLPSPVITWTSPRFSLLLSPLTAIGFFMGVRDILLDTSIKIKIELNYIHKPQPQFGHSTQPSFCVSKVPHSGQFLIVAFVIGLSLAYINPCPASFTACFTG